jgi:hypothetical protein
VAYYQSGSVCTLLEQPDWPVSSNVRARICPSALTVALTARCASCEPSSSQLESGLDYLQATGLVYEFCCKRRTESYRERCALSLRPALRVLEDILRPALRVAIHAREKSVPQNAYIQIRTHNAISSTRVFDSCRPNRPTHQTRFSPPSSAARRPC